MTSSLLSSAIESVNIEVINDMPIIPHKKTITEKNNIEKTPSKDDDFTAMASGISYHPSIENRRNIVYKLMPPFPKYSGNILPNKEFERIENINNKIPKTVNISTDARNANLIPFINFLMLGINLNSLNILNILNERSTNIEFVGMHIWNKNSLKEGNAISNIIKSNLFHPFFQ